MRVNKWVAQATGLSRRAVDTLIAAGQVSVNGQTATSGQQIRTTDVVMLSGKRLAPKEAVTVMLNKPPGYVCSRNGQGSDTIYALLPVELHSLKPVGRLDKNSSGLLLLTNDGELANQLTHPRYSKQKQYLVQLDKSLSSNDQQMIVTGVMLEDGLSKLKLTGKGSTWRATIREGRNRQIRRTFKKLGYTVVGLHRQQFGSFRLSNLVQGDYRIVSTPQP